MDWTLQFVDSIASSPTVRLDLNDGSPWGLLIAGTSFGAPTLKLAQASTLLRDGSAFPAGAYGERTLTLKLKLPETTRDAWATALQELHRELDRSSNFLKWQQDGASHPVFFRTIRTPPDRWDDFPFTPSPYGEVTVSVLTEPFAYGVRRNAIVALNSNGSFEVDLTGWTGQNASVARSTAQAWDGLASALVTPAGGAAANLLANATGQVSATVGASYAVQARVYSPGGWATGMQAAVNWHDGANGYLSTSSGSVTAISAGVWTLLTATVTAPASTVSARPVVVQTGTPSSGDVWYADEVEIRPVPTVSNNPAATNGCFLDLTDIRGDVETPLIIKASTTNLVSANDNHSLFAIRRGGTPSNAPFALQAEAMTLGTDASLPGNDAAMSGAGSNYARCSFGTTTAMATRLSHLWQGPGGAPSVDLRGQYRAFCRVRRSVAGDEVYARLRWGGTSGVYTNDTVRVTAGSTAISYIDLGMVSCPPGLDPVTDGLSGVELNAYGVFLDLQAQRAAGSGNVDFDDLLLVPADDGYAVIDWGTTSGANNYTVDCTQGVTYPTVTSGAVHGANMAGVSGGYRLMASPGMNNRLYFIRQVRAGAPTDTIGGTNDLDVSYFPRYLYVRPAST